MQQIGWSIRYLLHLFRQSYVLVVLLGIQLYVSSGTTQGAEILAIYAEEGTLLQLFIYSLGIFLSGFLYCFGAYWLFFFSNLKGRQYEASDEYADLASKLTAGNYQDYISLTRIEHIRFYTRLLLFAPIVPAVLYALSKPGFSWRLSLVILSVTSLNLVVVYGTSHRKAWFVVLAKTAFSLLARALERLFTSVIKRIEKLFHTPAKDRFQHEKQEHPIVAEVKLHSIRFARPQHRGFFYSGLMGALSLWCFLFFSPPNWITGFGALSVMQLGFSVWIVAIVWFGYVDKVYAFPIKLFLFFWILGASWINADHPIRLYPVQEKVKPENGAKKGADHFEQWLRSRPGSILYAHGDSIRIGGITYSPQRPYPVLLICAEGGASRSAFWTARMLSALRKKLGTSFDQHLFAISSVSGGSMGALLYSASRQKNSPEKTDEAISLFFTHDFLTPLTNRLVIGEPANWLSPQYHPSCDRAAAFEETIDMALQSDVFPATDKISTFREALKPASDHTVYQPLHLINTTEAETGRCFVLSDHDLSADPHFHQELIQPSLTAPIRLSTAMHLSARFPVFSPAAAITDANGITRHYVDGGYYDNVGYETARKLLKSIRLSRYYQCTRPVVYALVNEFEDDESMIETPGMDKQSKPNRSRNYWDGIHFLNEPLEILTAASKIRSANTDQHYLDLVEEVQERYSGIPAKAGIKFDLKSSAKLVPMNWMLSNRSKIVVDKKVQQAIIQAEIMQPDFCLKPVSHKSFAPKLSLNPEVAPVAKPADSQRAPKIQKITKPGLMSGSSFKRKRNQAPPGMYWSVSQKKWMPKSGSKYPIRPSRRKFW